MFQIDAHMDINTPSTSLSGNIHGMPLSFLIKGVPEVIYNVDLARALIVKLWLIIRIYKQKKLNRVMLNGDGNGNGIKINRSN